MLGTWTEGVSAVRERGVTVHDASGTRRVAVRATDDPRAVPPCDLALVLVKSYQTERAAAWAVRCLAPGGLAVTLQNGLSNRALLAAAVGPARAAAGVTFEGATVLAPGEIRHAGRGPTIVGDGPVPPPRLHVLAALLRVAGFDAAVVPGIDGLLWGKAVVNAAINPLTALWRVPNGDLLATAERRSLLAALALEAAAVAAALGIQLPYPDPVARVEEVCRATAANRSSMLQDVERARETEVDSINGVVVCEGHRLGIPVARNEMIWELVRAL